MAPFSVTPCATEHNGAFKFLADTGTDSLFSVSVPVMYSATICHILRHRTIWGAQAAHSPWDRHPSHNHDFPSTGSYNICTVNHGATAGRTFRNRLSLDSHPVCGDGCLMRNFTKVTARFCRHLNPIPTLTYEGHLPELSQRAKISALLSTVPLFITPPQPRMQRIEGVVILGSTAHPRRQISEAQPKKRSSLSVPLYPSQMLTHEVSRRSCAITGSRNVCTVIHGAILCHTVCNQARWRIQVYRRYWDRQPILGVSS